MMLVFPFVFALVAGSDAPIQIGTPAPYVCEMSNSVGGSFKMIAQARDWQRHDKNDSASVQLFAPDETMLSGHYMALARNGDVSLTNYLYNASTKTRALIRTSPADQGTILVERKVIDGETMTIGLFTGFCSGVLRDQFGKEPA